ncbi:hypothetical protein B0H12DRAFT_1093713 [Mycena haematopus]|nr:hypothetical protein B0H12DRAFT_1093713 [Mycena haematopus]
MAPQPILKRARTVAPDFDPFPHLLNPSVHFPPSPSLTRTFSAHSAATYDRTPIQVAPNACALPARGCPGRTYYDADPSRARYPGAKPHPTTGRGASVHPRALEAYEFDDDDEDERDAERTPTRTSPYIPLPAPPPLVPDLSSESDESDGFASPPPEPAGPPFVVGGKSPYGYSAYQMPPSSSYYPPAPYAYAYNTPTPAPSYTQLHTHSSASPPRHRTRPPPRRPQTPFARSEEARDGYEEEDLPRDFSHAGGFARRASAAVASVAASVESMGERERERERKSPPRERRSRPPTSSPSSPTTTRARSRSRSADKAPTSKREKGTRKESGKESGRMKGLCRSLAGASFRDAEGEGCLGGF